MVRTHYELNFQVLVPDTGSAPGTFDAEMCTAARAYWQRVIVGTRARSLAEAARVTGMSVARLQRILDLLGLTDEMRAALSPRQQIPAGVADTQSHDGEKTNS